LLLVALAIGVASAVLGMLQVLGGGPYSSLSPTPGRPSAFSPTTTISPL
jgi:hypothetical protein